MLVSFIVLSTGIVMLMIEVLRPGRAWPQVAGWWLRAALLNGVQAAMVFITGEAWDGWMLQNRLWSADGLGTTGGAIVGYLAITFVYYWWHRWRHEIPFLWCWFHQIHHSPQRIEIITSFYKHPFEIFLNSILSSAILYLGIGLNPTAAAQAVLLSGLAELFYHWNVGTPHWLGYIFQRPESHCVHHQDGLHTYNYADLPVWDIVFGTFHNPRDWRERCGFGSHGEERLMEMLCGMDISQAETVRSQA